MDWKNSRFVQTSMASNKININNNNNNNFNLYNKVAESCCKTPSHLCAVRDHPSNINIDGCVSKIEIYITSHLLIIALLNAVICVFLVIALIVTSILILRIKQKKLYESINNSNENN
jgi:hypothetical protein